MLLFNSAWVFQHQFPKSFKSTKTAHCKELYYFHGKKAHKFLNVSNEFLAYVINILSCLES